MGQAQRRAVPRSRTRAPPQPHFGIHQAARALLSGPEGRPEQAGGPLQRRVAARAARAARAAVAKGHVGHAAAQRPLLPPAPLRAALLRPARLAAAAGRVSLRRCAQRRCAQRRCALRRARGKAALHGGRQAFGRRHRAVCCGQRGGSTRAGGEWVCERVGAGPLRRRQRGDGMRDDGTRGGEAAGGGDRTRGGARGSGGDRGLLRPVQPPVGVALKVGQRRRGRAKLPPRPQEAVPHFARRAADLAVRVHVVRRVADL
eukprot:scaffold71454_cov90-Phaeocystis_antarctica.AAC.1